MEHIYHLTPVSGNKKTGPIPVTTSSRSTCPDICPLKKNGCYPEYGPLALHWDAVSSGYRGGSFDALCADLRRLPRHQLVRLWQAGDFPGDGKRLDGQAVGELSAAGRGKRLFGYTHYDVLNDAYNAAVVRTANEQGLTINLSANNLEHADALVASGVGPVVTLLPPNAPLTQRTPAGNFVAVCPAEYSDMNCARCGICAVPQRKAIIGFRAHGSGKAKAHKVFMLKTV